MYNNVMPEWLPAFIFIVAGMLLSIKFNKLTTTAAFTGAAIAMLVLSGGGYCGLTVMTLFFVVATLATSHQKHIKYKLEGTDAHEQKRNTGQVFANAGVAACYGLLSIIDIAPPKLCLLSIAACFAAATADTLSSELGMVYGKRFYCITNFKPDAAGRDGVISLEGTLIGVAGSMFIALVYMFFYGPDKWFIAIVIAGTAGNITDSYLGATLEQRGLLKNNAVNFLNTVVATLVMMTWYLVQGS